MGVFFFKLKFSFLSPDFWFSNPLSIKFGYGTKCQIFLSNFAIFLLVFLHIVLTIYVSTIVIIYSSIL